MPKRRDLLKNLNAGAAAVAALTLGGRALAQTKSTAPFQPARHAQDDWMDQISGKHRLIFDTVSNDAMGEALLFANNFLTANRNTYGLQNSDLAVIIVARHLSTGLGFNDAIWAKYGAEIAGLSKIAPAPQTNPHNAGAFGIEALAKQGIHFAVCAMATERVANTIARAKGVAAAAITEELTANLIPNARMVPAGIVAVSRAQERGYTLVTA
jgi:intracellular sulfur oxidation DsrE/DsrF family protein